MCGIYLGAGPWLEMTVEYAKEKEKQLGLFKFLKDPLLHIGGAPSVQWRVPGI